MEGFDRLPRSPSELHWKPYLSPWSSFCGNGPMPDLGFALWKRRFWILVAAVEKGFTAEEAEPNCDKDLVKTKRARFRILMGGRSARADRFRNMFQLHEPSVPWYPVENLSFVPKTTDWLAEVPALVDRPRWRANWVYRPFDHPYNTTYVPWNCEALIFCPRAVDAAMASEIARAIIANPCLQPP
ncbi:hypothetical protein F444_07248 [Phytophthora nicotianae P1976]|uniref:Uncharacterized protein n=1 Tax=Phytophthora nicotianae P1976 TaxID=1317066 RepID=A0A081AFA4_PHYNI|nr:hypothetical protein F444_07248 [Phytophthora nicotianae P1976]